MHRTGPYPLCRGGRSVHGSCSCFTLLGVVLPTLVRMMSRPLGMHALFPRRSGTAWLSKLPVPRRPDITRSDDLQFPFARSRSPGTR